MAYIRPYSKGRWRAEVEVLELRDSKVCETKTEARTWAAMRETQLRAQADPSNMTFRKLGTEWLERYPNRTKFKDEKQRLLHLLGADEDPTDFGKLKLAELDSVTISKWRDKRLKINKGSTVNRDLNLFSSICAAAVEEMGHLQKNPFAGINRPEEPPPRDRLATDDELKAIEHVAAAFPKMGRVYPMFLFGVQTGMSVGEICRLNHAQIDRKKRVATMPRFKTRPARQVPLSTKAMALIGPEGVGLVFGMTSSNADVAWRRICAKAGVKDLNFHDSRHQAATWMSKKIDALALAKLLGHTDLKMLIKVYYQADAASLVDKLG